MAYHDYSWYTDRVPVTYNWDELVQFAQLQQGTSWYELVNKLNSYGLTVDTAADVANLAGLEGSLNADGSFTAWVYNDKVGTFNYNAGISSDTNISSRAAVRAPINTTVTTTTDPPTVQFSNTPKSGSFTQDAIYLFSEVGQAVGATATGISLGKSIDARLYNANPDFWDSIGMSTLNPETWASITAGDTSLGATLFNFVFGIDANTGKAQAYMDSDAYAYMALWLMEQNVFAETFSGIDKADLDAASSYSSRIVHDHFDFVNSNFAGSIHRRQGSYYTVQCIKANISNCHSFILESVNDGSDVVDLLCLCSTEPFNWGSESIPVTYNPEFPVITSYPNTASAYTYDGNTVYCAYYASSGGGYYILNDPSANTTTYSYSGIQNNASNLSTRFGYDSWYSPSQTYGGVTGIDNQPNANLPDTSSWVDIPSTDAYLRSAYPNMYADGLQYDVLQPDGNVITKTYIPVPLPDNITSPDTQHANNPWDNQQPTSDDATQTTTEIDISTSPDDFIKQLIKTITQTVQTTDTINPPTTGTGDSPTPIPITGSASALWSVYHPSQAQVNSFGAWLWTDNIITQIQQVLQNPMDGIITLHKVFAMPVDSGTGTIVIGRLDSQVGTALVTQQYVTVDCGYVDCAEEFGNVFDYEPYTSLHLYLPFIGIVPLNVNEVMRSTLHVVYGVDVFTGACLATVEIARDGNAVNLYQYSGIAAVEYPLTGATHSGLLAGLAGIVGTIAMGAVTGGVGLVGAGAIANGAIQAATSKNAHASNFSGNAGAMGIKKPYLIIERPQTKVAETFPRLDGYPTNYSVRLGDCANHVVCKTAHVHGINATKPELEQIENYLLSGVEI